MSKEEKLNFIGNAYKENYVLFDLNFRANKIKSSYLLRDCINALSSFIDNKTVHFLGA